MTSWADDVANLSPREDSGRGQGESMSAGPTNDQRGQLARAFGAIQPRTRLTWTNYLFDLMAEQGRYDAGEVKPRNIPANPRCRECRDGGMFHPAHRWAPCIVVMPGGGRSPCR